MTALRLVFAYLAARPLSMALHVVLMALGVGAATGLLLFSVQSDARLSRDAQGVDLVVGHKGSPLQLVLSAVFQADVPAGNVPYALAATLAADRRVREAIPIGLGDSVGGFRIVGAAPHYLELYNGKLARGRLHTASMEAVLGAETAAALGLPIGSRFRGQHGLGAGGGDHDDAYTVVGILRPTGSVLDRLVVTPIESVWHVHEEHPPDQHAEGAHETEREPENREATAILLRLRSPIAAMGLKREINATTAFLAARPAEEATRLVIKVGVGAEILRGFALVLIAAAVGSVFVTLLTALNERRGEIALLRAMGATRGTVFGVLLGQGVITATAGTLIGAAAGHGAIAWLASASSQARGFALTGMTFHPGEVGIIAAGIAAGAAASMLPALAAYNTDIAKTLAEAP